jgi:hypothetical protein
MVIKRIEPISVGKLAGILYAAIGLVIGVLVAFVGLIGGMAGTKEFGALAGGLVGIGAIIALPIFYGLLGFVVFMIGAWLYNVAAGFVGGIRIDVE